MINIEYTFTYHSHAHDMYVCMYVWYYFKLSFYTQR